MACRDTGAAVAGAPVLRRSADERQPGAPTRRPPTATRPARAANHVEAYDFAFNACANGQQLTRLTVVHEFTHECLVIDVLTRLMRVPGAPVHLRSDSVPEFVIHPILQ